jgi:2-keto-4-pentenoate hydratase/2-oxohepta-3-ene-1,7-dioic acid hydratase in catechol pathway
MKYNVEDFPAHLTLVGELNGSKAYKAAGRAVRPYPPFVTAPQSVAGTDELVIEKSFVDVTVYPELFLVIGKDVKRGEGGVDAILGFGISLAMNQKSLVSEAEAKGGTARDISCCHWYQLQSDGTHIIGDELVENFDIGKCKLTLSVDGQEKKYNMADMIWKPDTFLRDMSFLARFRKNDMIFLGPVDVPMSLGEVKEDTCITVKSNCFEDLEVAVRFEK